VITIGVSLTSSFVNDDSLFPDAVSSMVDAMRKMEKKLAEKSSRRKVCGLCSAAWIEDLT
jgi:hypothetical protein